MPGLSAIMMAMIPPTTMMAMFMLSFPVSIPGQYQKERKEGLAAGELGGVLPNLNQTTIIPLPPISPLLLLPLLLHLYPLLEHPKKQPINSYNRSYVTETKQSVGSGRLLILLKSDHVRR